MSGIVSQSSTSWSRSKGGDPAGGLPHAFAEQGLFARAVACGESHTAVLLHRQGGWGGSRSGAAGGGRGGGGAEDEGERLVVTFGANDRGQCGQVNIYKKKLGLPA